jgi:hypothetical protein
VREASVEGPDYRYMMATNDIVERQPALAGDADLGGKQYLDFGFWGHQDTNVNSRWLYWAGTNGALQTLAVRAAFIVFGSHNGSGGGRITLLQHTSNAHFAPGLGILWASTPNTHADRGASYLDRVMRDGRNLAVSDKAYHLIENIPLQMLSANTFALDRIYPGYSGGSRICEALIFTAELTEAERLAVQDYLWHKWFDRSGDTVLGDIRLANGAALDIAQGADTARVNVAGDGIVAKSGAGELRLFNAGTDAFDGTVRLREGNLRVAGESYLLDIEEGGQALHAQDIIVGRSIADAGKVVKTGTGELAVASVAEGVAAIEVTAGSLRLATPRAAESMSVVDGAVNEWSLEAFTNGIGPTTVWVNYTPQGTPTATVHGWRFDRSAYASGGFLVGIAFDYPRSGRVIGEGLAPDGDTVLYLNRGIAETDFTVPAAGIYRLSFYAAAREGNLNRHVEVKLDGATVRTIVTPGTVFWKHAVLLPHLAAGTHTIGFEGIGETLTEFGRVAFIDAIRIAPVRLCEEIGRASCRERVSSPV